MKIPRRIVMMERKVRIAIIDSGIDDSIGDLRKNILLSFGVGVNQNGYIEEKKAFPEKNQHATAVAGIIQHFNPNVEFLNIKLLDENLSADVRVLLYALSKVFDYKPDIIHLSLGTENKKYTRYFKKIIKEAKKSQVLLVAAAGNNGEISYPAYLKGVIGVKADRILGVNEFYFKDKFFYAPAGIDNIPALTELVNHPNMCGNSMAAAYITGHISKSIQDNDLTFLSKVKEYKKL